MSGYCLSLHCFRSNFFIEFTISKEKRACYYAGLRIPFVHLIILQSKLLKKVFIMERAVVCCRSF